MLADLLPALGLRRGETLFLTSFGPVACNVEPAAAADARSSVWPAPIAELPRLLVNVYQPEEGGDAIVASVLLDAGSVAPDGRG